MKSTRFDADYECDRRAQTDRNKTVFSVSPCVNISRISRLLGHLVSETRRTYLKVEIGYYGL